MRPLHGVLFDIDGTLLDTRDAWIAAFDAGLAATGKASMTGSFAAQWIGTPIETIYAERCHLDAADLGRAVHAFQRVEAESVRRGMRPFPRIAALRVTGLLPLFRVVVGGDSVTRKKPAPDSVLRAASELAIDPSECVVVGDTENDVLAGKAAGAMTIGVTWGYGTRAQLEAAGVEHLIETPDALPPLVRALTPSRAA